MMFCVGLTGGIGSGKSTVADFFAQLGVAIIDADVIAREVMEPGASAYTAVQSHFGTTDRKKLRQIIFQNPSEKIWLEKMLHPLILETMRQKILRSAAPYCIAVIPLLVETLPQVDFIQRICVVDAPEALRKAWAAKRDQVSSPEIEAIIAAQASQEARLAIADDVITNNQDLKSLKSQVEKLHRQYLQMAHS